MTKLLEEAKLPSTEPYPRDWWTEKESRYAQYSRTIEEDSFAPRDWTLNEYIRTGVEYPGPSTSSSFKHSQVESHNIPQVTWEFLDPKLPILRVTAHAQQRLPLTNPGSPEHPKFKNHSAKYITRYSVSFVISLQNRWTSFDDPDRWIVRFGEDLELYLTPPHHVDRGQGKGPSYIPDYWNDNEPEAIEIQTNQTIQRLVRLHAKYGTDLPQLLGRHRLHATPDHRAVLLTVHESPVLQPGAYSRIPRISQWEAPGHILTEEQVPEDPPKRCDAKRAHALRRLAGKKHIRDLAPHIPAQRRVPAARARHGNSQLRPGDRDVGGVRHGIVGGVRPEPEQKVEEPTR